MIPATEQYSHIKKLYSDHIVLMHFDDWMQALEKDAKTVSEVCGVTVAMSHDGHLYASFPYFAIEHHIRKLIEAGHKVALAEPVKERS